MQSEDAPEWLNSIARSLREGDEVRINGRSRAVTVTERTYQDGIGSSYPHEHVWMEGNGTEYILVVYSIDDYHPKLYSASEWHWLEYENIEDEIRFETGAAEKVRSLKTDEERAMVADLSASEFIEPTVPEKTWAEDYQPAAEEASGDVIGGCPDCQGEVVETGEKATCTECPLWCPADEWRAYHAE